MNDSLMEKATRKIVYWDCNDPERLIHEDKNEAIEYYLDSMLTPFVPISECNLPEEVTVKGYARLDVRITGEEVLENAINSLDEEYGDPYGDPFRPTEEQIEAANEFADIFNHHYRCWACEEVVVEKVNTTEWIKNNRPDWLEVEE